ncbi:serine/threonine-protein kinase [Sandaracinus amylolyticus]|uniref:non-specific serine/threonine protein kinase n=1 Tax=Sandaracinus amylolyticus TaxID=927083 RepID=A0A0F6W5M2_9BACT|nr:serine/threonine-protein kinase [Sandaracinus amylolyticus]AKF08093.1 serine/threonine protein kinase [Sandaracinus amylolyticus]
MSDDSLDPARPLREDDRDRTRLEDTRDGMDLDPAEGHPGFATTALGAGDVRDTPRMPTLVDEERAVDPWIGRVLSNVYRVEGKIGEGGMGAVYAVRHVHLGKQYAVKVLSAGVAQNATAVERLKQEAIAASSIEHDNIVEVISFDRYADGAVFIVMEYLRGESLAERVARGPLPLHEALAIAHQIAAALAKAHQHDIVHRDLKPENVYLAKKGDAERAKVLDFGISKVKSADAEQVKMTRTGQLVGTPLYMSPEQARGEAEIDRRVDVYALGVMLYEMLTGSPPFEGRNYFELLWKHGNEPAQPPKQRNPNVFIPDEVEAVVLRALAKKREERFQTMEELAEALRMAAPDVAVPTTASLPPRSVNIDVAREVRPSPAVTLDAPPPAREQRSTESIPAPPTTRVPMAAWVGGALVALAAIALVASAMAGEPEAPPPTIASAPQPAITEPEIRAPEVAEPEVREPETDPARVAEVALDSTPTGAEVRVGERVLGTTPLFADLPIGAPLTLVFHHDGYVDEEEVLVPAAGARVSVRLRRRAIRGGSGSSVSSLPMKTEL